ncbi:MAG: iron-sulfur cluster repair di-iron protein [Fuerstiella sp.]|nr:iron-sulfur cluster repair di-iron protein [Fuerstiella sp.]MCP4853257.1 iron-sulfur cluster repair di-iron protein [Fuerstiella sp.]
MPVIDTTRTVGDWVAEHPETARVFEELQIDYCCGGNQLLADVCKAKDLDATAIVSRFNDVIAQSDGDLQPDCTEMSLSELCDHIEVTHHAFLKTELPRLTQLTKKVVDAHGSGHAELLDLQAVYAELREELEPHMLKEEIVLFPAIRLLEHSEECPGFPFGTVSNPIRMMEHEHDNAGNALKRIRKLTRDFLVPADACNTWRTMLDGLQNLERDLHQHIHKENNILFPRAEQLNAVRIGNGCETS